MEKYNIVPDLIDVAPEQVVEVSYPCGVKVEQGNILTPTQVKDNPTIKWSADDNELYTVCMTDPDTAVGEVQHWLIGNVPGGDVDKGETLSEYIGSGPPQGTGLHRYVFLVYKQSGRIDFDEKRLTNKSSEGRGHFSIKKFAVKYNLGRPVAGNFYRAEWDEYVPILKKQLSG